VKLRFLGSGTSHGVPVVGCSCPVCTSNDPRDSRYRTSVIVEGDHGEVLLIDAGPEFRLQALRARLTRLDAILVTHAHADHIHGLDDVRPLTRGKPLPVYASAPDLQEIRDRFAYAFREGQLGGGKPRLVLTEIEPGVTEVAIVEYLRALSSDHSNIEAFLRDMFAELVILSHGGELPPIAEL